MMEINILCSKITKKKKKKKICKKIKVTKKCNGDSFSLAVE